MVKAMMNPTENLMAHIQEAVKKAAEEHKEAIIKQATQEFEKEVRDRVGRIVIQLGEYISYERMGNELVIHVKFEKEK